MEYIDVEGPTPQDALRRVLSKIGITKDEVKHKVISEGTGGQPARVRVWALPKEVIRTKEVIDEFLEAMGVRAKPEFLLISKKHYRVNLECRRDDSVLIGKKGETLQSLEYLLNLILRRKKIRVQLELDVSGYKQRQLQQAINKALAIAVQVKQTGKEMTIDPLPPDRRNRVREILRQDPDIRVYTAGKGPRIYLVVAPRKKNPTE